MNASKCMKEMRRFPARGGQGRALSRLQLAFTLIELLVVITIIGIVAAISVPAIKNFNKADADAAATRQLLDDIARARQFAISHRSTVYMTFVPSDFWTLPGFNFNSFTLEQKTIISNLLARQMIGYNFISLRDVGDQLGQPFPKYLSEWRSLPEGMFICTNKFMRSSDTLVMYDPFNPPRPGYPTITTYSVRGFDTNIVPFPTADSPIYLNFPCLTFNSNGQLVSNDQREEEIIPLARGKAILSLDANKRPFFSRPTLEENPPGNSTNAYTLIVVDSLTGRAHVEHQTPQ